MRAWHIILKFRHYFQPKNSDRFICSKNIVRLFEFIFNKAQRKSEKRRFVYSERSCQTLLYACYFARLDSELHLFYVRRTDFDPFGNNELSSIVLSFPSPTLYPRVRKTKVAEEDRPRTSEVELSFLFLLKLYLRSFSCPFFSIFFLPPPPSARFTGANETSLNRFEAFFVGSSSRTLDRYSSTCKMCR